MNTFTDVLKEVNIKKRKELVISDLIYEYNNIQSDLNLILNDLKLYNQIEIYSAFIFLLNSGFLSKNKFFVHIKKEDFWDKVGLSIILGYGVCRHKSNYLYDLYNISNIENYLLVGYIDGEFFPSKEIEELFDFYFKCFPETLKNYFGKINDSKEIPDTFLNKILYKILYFFDKSNHIINISNQHNKTFVIDPTNLFIFKPENSNIFIDENTKNFFEVSIKSTKKYFNCFPDNLLRNNIVSYEEYREYWLQTLNICFKNIDLFNDFYENHKEVYNYIYNEFYNLKYKKS